MLLIDDSNLIRFKSIHIIYYKLLMFFNAYTVEKSIIKFDRSIAVYIPLGIDFTFTILTSKLIVFEQLEVFPP